MSNSMKLTVSHVSIGKGNPPMPMPNGEAPKSFPYNANITLVISDGVGVWANSNGMSMMTSVPCETSRPDIAVDDVFPVG
jgi:hypothetical protein